MVLYEMVIYLFLFMLQRIVASKMFGTVLANQRYYDTIRITWHSPVHVRFQITH